MEIIRGALEFKNFFENLENIRIKKGLNLKKVINDLKLLTKGIICIPDKEVMEQLIQLKIINMSNAIEFLSLISNYYSFDKVIKEIDAMTKQYGITHLAFINEKGEKVIEVANNMGNIIKIYQPSNCEPYWEFLLDTNGISEAKIMGVEPFIVDKKDLVNSSLNERILYTRDLNIYRSTFPSKEEMDIYNIKREREYLFKELLMFLQNKNVTLIMQDPNTIFFQNEFIGYDKNTIRSDGVLLDKDNQMLYPTKLYYPTPFIKVLNANFVLITKVNEENVAKIYLIINPNFLENILDKEIWNILNNFEKEDIDLKYLMKR